MRRSLEDDAVTFKVTVIVEADDAAGIDCQNSAAEMRWRCILFNQKTKIRYVPWRSTAAKLDGWLGWTHDDGRG